MLENIEKKEHKISCILMTYNEIENINYIKSNIKLMEDHEIIVLDADLVLDTGLLSFQSEFPDRFFECGIAEQDMVSQAGGMALEGKLPIVHSFSCFLSARPNEQIYNNATERTKIVYVGSLAGLIPGGPGHSHQAVRDISSLAAVPGLIMCEPSCESEVRSLLNWAIAVNNSSTYIRLVSVPWEITFEMPKGYEPNLGKGVAISDGEDSIIFAYGPIMLSIAYEVSTLLKSKKGLNVKVINLPWLNQIDEEWFMREVKQTKNIYSIDNHYIIGGQGDRIASMITRLGLTNIKFNRLGIETIPVSGENANCLIAHEFSVSSIFNKILKSLI